jgi:hypothetical protein
MPRKLPPIGRKCWRALGEKWCKFTCRGKVKVARFEATDSDEYAILHPSTKKRGKWQLSWFDADGPYGDSERSTCSEAVKEMSTHRWKLTDWR